MNKGVLIAIVIAVLLLGGVGFMVMRKNQSPGETVAPTSSSSQTTSGNVFSSIKDALSKSLSLECSFADDQGRQTKSYVKNGAVRADITSVKAEESSSIIMKDKTMYFWNARGGFKMQIPEAQGTPSSGQGTAGTTGTSQATNVMGTLEKFKDSCKPAVVSDSMFSPPAEVQFKDFSEMMKAPTGSPMPTYDQSQMQQNIQQYTPPKASQ